MTEKTGIQAALLRKAGWIIGGTLLCAILALIGEAAPIPSLTATDLYTVQSSYLKKNEAPWLFDGDRRADGKIVAIRDADTAANKSACANEWKDSNAYRPLCIDLQNQKIISVDVSGLRARLVTHVPVSRLARVAVSDQVLIKMGDISEDRVTHALPSFVRVLR